MLNPKFGPEELAQSTPVPLHCGDNTAEEGCRQAETLATLEEYVKNLLNMSDDTRESFEQQAHAVRQLEKRSGLSPSHATAVAANLGLGAVSS
jgi:hypothetical protein